MRKVLATILLLSGCGGQVLPTSGCEWVPPPPRPELCEPGQNPHVDENLVAECTALTKPAGDWWLEIDKLGRENCAGSGW